jgi:hypothetical protein
MKHLHLPATLGIFGVLAFIGSVALLNPHKATADEERCPNGRVYVITVNDSTGNFASRGVIALHADHTMSVTDSGQGGPTFFFSSQLGSWKSNGQVGIVAKTIDFDFPPNADVARLDYTIQVAASGTQVTGTITLTSFPLESNPLDGGGTVVGTFTFSGQRVTA